MTYPSSRTQAAIGADVLVLGLSGCGAITVQNPSSSLKPVNALGECEARAR